jgi:hypothetical protein
VKHRIKVTVTGYYEVEADIALANYEGATTAAEVAAIDQRGYDEQHVSAAEVIEWCDGEVEVVVEAASEGVVVTHPDGTDSGLRVLPGHTPEDHEYGHDHLHGEGDGQHTHAGWTPDRVIARMKRDGWCGFQYQDDKGVHVCMERHEASTHTQVDVNTTCKRPGCTERLTHIHPAL